MRVTAAQQERYAESRRSVCPSCGSGDIASAGRPRDMGDLMEVQEAECCISCGSLWEDVFVFDRIEDLYQGKEQRDGTDD